MNRSFGDEGRCQMTALIPFSAAHYFARPARLERATHSSEGKASMLSAVSKAFSRSMTS
jgi:hypothetical protein